MYFLKLLILTAATLAAFYPAKAPARQCSQLFEKSYKTYEFIIAIGGKKQSEKYLAAAHNNLISSFEISNLNEVLKIIKDSGLEKLTLKQRKLIIKFRQNSSFLRSIFQTSSKKHKSPAEFADFVRDFGILKDLLLMEDSPRAKEQAQKILKDYSELDFDALMADIAPASKKSVKKYFNEILKDTVVIMSKNEMTVDEVHEVRKNLRDVLRYMQIQNEVAFAKTSGSKIVSLNQRTEIQDTQQIEFLKKINTKLGEICDEYAAQILKGEISDYTIVQFPEKIRQRVEYFLELYKIQIED